MRVEKDDHMRPDSTLEGLAALPPSFGKDGSVTAGNASGIVDGAAAGGRDLGQNAARREKAARPDRFLGQSSASSRSSWGWAPRRPRAKRIAKAGLSQNDIGLWEINEAFAGQILGVVRELGLDLEKLNVNGGAIALGHPLAATGTRLHADAPERDAPARLRYGLAGACIGGGQGIAVVLESAA